MKLRRSIFVIVIVLVSIGVYLISHSMGEGSLRRRAAVIKIGDSKAHVRGILGRPTESCTGSFFLGPEWWAYGGSPLDGLDWHKPAGNFPWMVSLKFKLSPESNQVAVYFNTDRVARVYIPPK